MPKSTCSIEGCGRASRKRGWCSTHYTRWRRHGDPSVCLRGENVCGVDGCENSYRCSGYCDLHYRRWLTNGDPMAVSFIRGDNEARFWSKVAITPSCWLWLGWTDRDGYGALDVAGKFTRAHRYAYELLIGPIPEGLTLDHVVAWGCHHKNCVNPGHLEPVTAAENTRRENERRAMEKRSA